MKKKLIFSSFDDLKNPFYGGGGAVAVHSVAKRLVDKFSVTVITGSYPGSKDENVDGVIYKRIGVYIFGPKISQLIYQSLLPLFVFSSRFDFWIESFTPPFSTGFLQLFTKKPVIGLVHMLSGEDMERKYRLPFTKIENIGLRTYNQFIVLSKESKKHIEAVNPSAKIDVIPNGVDIPSNLLRYNQRSLKHLLFIGRIEVNQKGLDKLLEATSLISNKKKTTLIIAGTGEISELKKLQSLINKYKLQKVVHCVGRVVGAEKDKLFRESSLLLLPSRYETFSITALEGIAYGLPIVCFDIQGFKWLSKKMTSKVTPFSSERYAKAIIELLESNTNRQAKSDIEIGKSKEYSWDKVTNSYLKVLGK